MSPKRIALAAILGAVIGLAQIPASSAEVVTYKATGGRFLLAGFYPSYVLFLLGLDANTKTAWVDKKYWGVIDLKDGPEAGKSVVVELEPTSANSPNPQWCRTEGGANFAGRGITCLAGDPGTEQLRFRVRAWGKAELPAAFAGRDVVEYPNLPGRRESEVLGAFEFHVLKE